MSEVMVRVGQCKVKVYSKVCQSNGNDSMKIQCLTAYD